MLPFLLAALTFAALLPVLLPLLRGLGSSQDGAAFDRAVYRDQLREVDRDIERGLLTEADSVTVRLEIQRRLLSAAPDEKPPRAGKARVLAAAIGILAAGGAIGVYLVLGMPTPPLMSGPEAVANAAIAQLADRVREHPDDAEAWTLYARTASRLALWTDAEAAWRRVIALGDASPEAVASLGEILVLRENGTVGDEARGLFDMALRGEPSNEIARYYLALAASQGGDAKGALAQWQALLDDMPPDAPGRRDVTRRMEDTARAAGIPMPSAADRAAIVQAMVAKLAARLAKEPEDAAGWARLGRSYAVLGQGEAAADAYEKAAALKPAEPLLKLAAAEALMTGLKPEDPLPPRAMSLLREIEVTLPEEPAVLWYLGLAAARDRQVEQARDYWTRLSKLLPPDGEDAKMVRAALGALAGRP
jgi:cytochrome c-type biogenesis protein CcmH